MEDIYRQSRHKTHAKYKLPSQDYDLLEETSSNNGYKKADSFNCIFTLRRIFVKILVQTAHSAKYNHTKLMY